MPDAAGRPSGRPLCLASQYGLFFRSPSVAACQAAGAETEEIEDAGIQGDVTRRSAPAGRVSFLKLSR